MSEYAGPILWSVLPGQVTHALLPTLSGALPRLLPPAPRGSPGYASNFRRVFSVLVLGWLAYTFATEAAKDASASGDWYALLGVGTGATDDELRRAFRSLSRKFHPDVLGAHAPAWAEQRFIAIRAAYEGLSDPVRRFAYDRFGPDIAAWGGRITTTRAFMVAGAQRAAGMYIATVALLALLYVLGRARGGTYWRLVLVVALGVAEASLVLAPTPPHGAPPTSLPLLSCMPRVLAAPLVALLPRSALDRPTYQYIALLRRLATDAGVAISQLAGVWDDTPDPRDRARAAASLAAAINADAHTALAHEIRPVLESTNDPMAARRNLLERIEQVVVDDAALRHPVVRGEFERVLAEEMSPPAAAEGKGVTGRLETSAEVELADELDAASAGESRVVETPPRWRPTVSTTAAQRRRGESPAPPSPLRPNHNADASPPASSRPTSPRASPKPSPSRTAASPAVSHSRTDSADTIDTISHADLIAIGKAMPLPPSPPATPAPDSFGQVLAGTGAGAGGRAGVDGPADAKTVVPPSDGNEGNPPPAAATPEPPRRRSARLSRTPG